MQTFVVIISRTRTIGQANLTHENNGKKRRLGNKVAVRVVDALNKNGAR
jgi:hypothetical protein